MINNEKLKKLEKEVKKYFIIKEQFFKLPDTEKERVLGNLRAWSYKLLYDLNKWE